MRSKFVDSYTITLTNPAAIEKSGLTEVELRSISVPSMSPDELKNWVAERRAGVQNSRFGVESIKWRDYHNKWHTAFWELMYHKHSSYKQLLDLNHKQAARIMELEHDLRLARRNHE